MTIEDLRKVDPLTRLLHWIRERHAVFLKKEDGQPKPWTTDPVIQTTHFTNPYRENDRTTRWVAENIRGPLVNDDRVAFATLAFRWFNWIPTGDLLTGRNMGGWHKDWSRANYLLRWDTQGVVNRLRAGLTSGRLGGKIFTGAFMITNGNSSKPKLERVAQDYIHPVWDRRKEFSEGVKAPTLAAAHAYLHTLPGMGGTGFMAAQVIADLKHTHILAGVDDWWTWCSPGPGSRRGMNIIQGRPVAVVVPRDIWFKELTALRTSVNAAIDRYGMPPLCAQDMQNCLCEFSKYDRGLLGDGRTKRKYPGV